MCLQISQKLLHGKHDAESVRNMWNRYWSMFKEVRRRQEHTGGGDGDDATEDDGEDEDEREGAHEKKRKRAGQAKKVRYTKNVLDSFESSSFFAIIDAV